MVTPKVKWHAHTHTHNNLSLTLNGAVRLALNPESHAKRRSSSVVSLPLEDKKKRGAEKLFAGSSCAARSDLDKPSPSKPRFVSALLALRSVKLRVVVGSLRVQQPDDVRSDGGQTEHVEES